MEYDISPEGEGAILGVHVVLVAQGESAMLILGWFLDGQDGPVEIEYVDFLGLMIRPMQERIEGGQ